MTETFKPIVYLKQHCPFCMKIRLFILEASIGADVQTREFAAARRRKRRSTRSWQRT